MAETPTVIEIRRLRQALDTAAKALQFAEDRIPDTDVRRQVRDARLEAERELAQNAQHYEADY